MDDYNRNKLWIAIGRCGAFTDGDNFIFRVWPDSEQFAKNKHWDLMPKFIDAQSIEDARSQAHWFIDKMFNEFTKYDPKPTAIPTPVPGQKWTPAPPPQEDSLSIEGASEAPKSDMLLDLKDLT